MRNRLFRNFLMAVVLVIGLFASVFMGSNNMTTVAAETTTANLPVVEVRTNAAYVNESTIRSNFPSAVFTNEGSETVGTSMTKYSYFIETNSVSTDVLEGESNLSRNKECICVLVGDIISCTWLTSNS